MHHYIVNTDFPASEMYTRLENWTQQTVRLFIFQIKISSMPSLSVCRCCNKLPQTDRLKTTDIYSLTALEAGAMIQNQGADKAMLPLGVPGKNLFFASPIFCWRLLTSLSMWPCHSSLCCRGHTALSPACVRSPSGPLLQRHPLQKSKTISAAQEP